MDEGVPLLEGRGITKRFGPVAANESVDVAVRRGEVHAVLGENGAGKSTLAAVLAGLYRPEEGSVWRDGIEVDLHRPRDAWAVGVAMVHQHFRLVERFTVAENVALGDPTVPRRLSMRAVESRVAEVAAEFGLPVDPRARVGDLAVGERQRVEIVKALARRAEVLLLDEPTAVLTPPEVDALFATLRTLTASGKGVMFISHKLREVVDVADRVTVMRAGRVTGEVDAGDTDTHRLARLMVGQDVDLEVVHGGEPAEVVLAVEDVTVLDAGRARLSDVSLRVRAGEVLGVAGVSGNGQRELVEVVAGLRRPSVGRVTVRGTELAGGPRGARAAGVAFVPEERFGTGLAPSLSIAENVMLTRPRRWWVHRRRARAEARALIERFDVRAATPDTPTRRLSGGNAQKVLLGRELTATDTRVLVVASPTRGLDVGAIASIRGAISEIRDAGAAVLLSSEDLDEVLSMADRVVVLYRGRVVLVTEADGSREAIGRAMAGVT